MSNTVDYEHPCRYRGKSSSRSWIAYATSILTDPKYKKHIHRVDGLKQPDKWVIVERKGSHYCGSKKYYEYWYDTNEFCYSSRIGAVLSKDNKVVENGPYRNAQDETICAVGDYKVQFKCSCKAYQYQTGIGAPFCKHIKELCSSHYELEMSCTCKGWQYSDKTKPCKHMKRSTCSISDCKDECVYIFSKKEKYSPSVLIDVDNWTKRGTEYYEGYNKALGKNVYLFYMNNKKWMWTENKSHISYDSYEARGFMMSGVVPPCYQEPAMLFEYAIFWKYWDGMEWQKMV